MSAHEAGEGGQRDRTTRPRPWSADLVLRGSRLNRGLPAMYPIAFMSWSVRCEPASAATSEGMLTAAESARRDKGGHDVTAHVTAHPLSHYSNSTSQPSIFSHDDCAQTVTTCRGRIVWRWTEATFSLGEVST